jgi:hypothetical protein
MLLYSPRWLFLYPGLLLMFLGTLAVLWLIPGSRQVRSVTLDIHTLLYAAFAVIIGFQAVLFALFAQTLAASAGFLHHDPLAEKVSRAISLETGLVCGAVLFLLGLGGSITAFVTWEKLAFGSLDPTRMMRIIIPAGLLMCLGCQIVLSSFFLGLLGMARRKR